MLPPESLQDSEEKAFRLRDWKRAVKRFAAQPASSEKYREGYTDAVGGESYADVYPGD